jgi:hypothetical protein
VKVLSVLLAATFARYRLLGDTHLGMKHLSEFLGQIGRQKLAVEAV